MYSSSDFEHLFIRYKAESVPQGKSILSYIAVNMSYEHVKDEMDEMAHTTYIAVNMSYERLVCTGIFKDLSSASLRLASSEQVNETTRLFLVFFFCIRNIGEVPFACPY